jgi:hypothetical protein
MRLNIGDVVTKVGIFFQRVDYKGRAHWSALEEKALGDGRIIIPRETPASIRPDFPSSRKKEVPLSRSRASWDARRRSGKRIPPRDIRIRCIPSLVGGGGGGEGSARTCIRLRGGRTFGIMAEAAWLVASWSSRTPVHRQDEGGTRDAGPSRIYAWKFKGWSRLL